MPLPCPASTLTSTLPGGLTLLFEARPTPGFAFELRLPIGSAHDPVGAEGTAGVLEEWLYKGAAHLDAHALADRLDELGLERGGGVAAESFSFAASGLAEDFPAALALYADILRRPRLPGAELPPLLDLARQDLDSLLDQPAERTALALRRLAFGTGYSHPVSGTPSGLLNITPEGARALHGRFSPRGASLAVVGGLDASQVQQVVEAAFGDWRGPPTPPVPLGFRPGLRLHLEAESAQTHLALVQRGPDPRGPHWLGWQLALAALSGGSASRLFHAVREERGLAYSVGAGAQLLGGQGFLHAYAGSTPQRAAETLAVLRAELDRLRQGLSEAEFARAREALLSATVFGAESARARAGALNRDLALLGRTRTPQEWRSEVMALTLPGVNALLADFDPGEPSLVTLGPEAVDA